MVGIADLPNGIRLRTSQPGDADFERRLHDASRQDLWLANADADTIHEVIRMQHHAKTEGHGAQHPNAQYYIIEKTGEACGRLVLDFTETTVHIVDLALLPEAQGKGIASTVVSAVQNAAAQTAAPVIAAAVWYNTPALNLWRRHGFVPHPEQPHPGVWFLCWVPAAPAG